MSNTPQDIRDRAEAPFRNMEQRSSDDARARTEDMTMKQWGLISGILLVSWFIVLGTGSELRKIFPAWYDFISLASGLLMIVLSWYIVARKWIY